MSNTFDHLGLPETMMSALKRMNFTTPTPIQARTIPVAMQGRDVLGSAQTGTGKTGAFCIPIIAQLMEDEKAMALVVTPTRELATQILDVVHKLTSNNRGIRTALLIGGDSMGKQFAQLRERPRMIIGTPGRINDHLRRDGALLSRVKYVAIDEADRMLDMGFSVQLDEILKSVPQERQTLMFSATFPDSIIKFSRNYLNNPERIAVNPEAVSAPKIKHEVKKTNADKKYVDLLAELEAREGSVIIFVKTQHGTDRLAKRLEADNHTATPIHGGLRQNQRDRAVRDFRSMRTRILVATDVASRGLDIPHIEHVINYDMPQVAEDYIHRIGRTARAGAEGNAVAFVMPSDMQMWNSINRIMNPDAKPERVEGPQGNRGGYKGKKPHGGNGYQGRGGDFWKKHKDFGNEGREEFGGKRKFGDRPFGDRKGEGHKFPSRDGRSFGDGERRARPQGDRPFNSDRPRPEHGRGDREFIGDRFRDRPKGDRPSGDKPFVKYYDKDGAAGGKRAKPTDGNWNNKEGRARYNSGTGKFEQPRSEGRGDGRQDNYRGNDRGTERSRNFKRSEGQDGGKPFYKKDDGFKKGGFKSEQRSFGDRPQFDKPKRDRNHRFDGTPRDRSEGDFKPRREGFKGEGFKSEGFRGDGPRKPKADKAPAKKPFKFKEHSRKDSRGSGPKNRASA